ncbi:MAG: glutamate--tRNA ligase [Promethearchaeota archaeon]
MEGAERILTIEALKNAVEFKKVRSKAVLGKLMQQMPEYRKKPKEIMPILDKVVKKVNELSKEQCIKELLKLDPHAFEEEKTKSAEEKVLPDLPNAEIGNKKIPVVMRLAPYPSGALHIGNARMLVLNDEYVKKYRGQLIFCYDDTIGASEKAIKTDPHAKFIIPEAYDLIKDGLEWLCIDYDKQNVIYKSDRVEIYKKYAVQFIKDCNAYVCTCKAGVFREQYKKVGKNCPCRGLSVEENLDRWEKMLDGTFGEGEAVVRLKTGMDQKDPAVRDHIIMRISDATHPRIGKKCRIWPLLDFSWGIDDYELGITHIIRGIDLQKEGWMEEFIWDLMGWPKKEILLYGRLNFKKDIKLSKTESRIKIEKGIYDGWNDPRTWSLQSLKSRGIRPEALRETLLNLGMSMNTINFSEKWLYANNSKIIDQISNRYWFVEKPVPVEIIGLKKDRYISTPLLNPNNKKLGTRFIELNVITGKTVVFISELDTKVQKSRKGKKIRYPNMQKGDIFRLKDLFTIKIQDIDFDTGAIKSQFLIEEMNHNIRKIQWVPSENNCKVKVLKPNGTVLEGLAESTIRTLPVSTVFQFERYGFVKIRKIETNYIYCYYTQ